ncbi:hypothetical protein ACNKHU_16395 [Shigella flexneri]
MLPFLQPIDFRAMVLAKNLIGNNTPLKLPAMLVKIKTPNYRCIWQARPRRRIYAGRLIPERREWWRAALTMLTSFRLCGQWGSDERAFGLLKTLPV